MNRIPKHIWDTAVALDELMPFDLATSLNTADAVHWGVKNGLITASEASELLDYLLCGFAGVARK